MKDDWVINLIYKNIGGLNGEAVTPAERGMLIFAYWGVGIYWDLGIRNKNPETMNGEITQV